MKFKKIKIDSKKNIFIEDDRKRSKGIVLMWFMFAVVIVLTIHITIQTATSGARLVALELERKELEKENQILSSKIVRSASLVKIENEADKLGFVEPENIVYIKARESVAELPESAF